MKHFVIVIDEFDVKFIVGVTSNEKVAKEYIERLNNESGIYEKADVEIYEDLSDLDFLYDNVYRVEFEDSKFSRLTALSKSFGDDLLTEGARYDIKVNGNSTSIIMFASDPASAIQKAMEIMAANQ